MSIATRFPLVGFSVTLYSMSGSTQAGEIFLARHGKDQIGSRGVPLQLIVMNAKLSSSIIFRWVSRFRYLKKIWNIPIICIDRYSLDETLASKMTYL